MRLPALTLLACAAVRCCLAADAPDLTGQYRATADKLIDAALADTEGYNRLAYLCYRIGNRLSGSPGLEKASRVVAWNDEGRGIEQRPRDSGQGAALGAWRGIGAHAGAAGEAAPHARPRHERRDAARRHHRRRGGRLRLSTSSRNSAARRSRARSCVYNEEYRGYGPTRVYRSTGAVARR